MNSDAPVYSPYDSDTESVSSTAYSPHSPASSPPSSPIASRTRLTLAVANVNTGSVSLRMPTVYDVVGNSWRYQTAIDCANFLTNGVFPCTISLKCHDEFIVADSDDEEVIYVRTRKVPAWPNIAASEYVLSAWTRRCILSFLTNEDKHWLACTSKAFLERQPNLHFFVTPRHGWNYQRCRLVRATTMIGHAEDLNDQYDVSAFSIRADYERNTETTPLDINSFRADRDKLEQGFLIVNETLEARWIEGLFAPHLNCILNDEDHLDILGIDKTAPYHMAKYPWVNHPRCTEPTSQNYTLYWVNAISKHMTCKACGHLTCCNGYTNKMNDYAEFRSKHVKSCPFMAMLNKLDDDELEALSFYVKMPTYMYPDLNLPVNWPFICPFRAEELVNGNDWHFFKEGAVAINHVRYNVYYDADGNREEIPITSCPLEFEIMYRDGHIFSRTQIKNGCHYCLNHSCPNYGCCIEFEHYHRRTEGRHLGAKVPYMFNQV